MHLENKKGEEAQAGCELVKGESLRLHDGTGVTSGEGQPAFSVAAAAAGCWRTRCSWRGVLRRQSGEMLAGALMTTASYLIMAA
jgi:hypothetical protein